MYNPCGSNGRCIGKPGYYDCNCKAKYKGLFDEMSPGGIDITPFSGHPGRHVVLDYDKEQQNCRLNTCKSKAGNRQCNPECNKLACKFDGGDFNHGINLWKSCNATSNGEPCSDLFNNCI